MDLIPWTVPERRPAKSPSDEAHCLSLALGDSRVMWPLSGSPQRKRRSLLLTQTLGRLHTGMPTNEAVRAISHTSISALPLPFRPGPVASLWSLRLGAYIDVIRIGHFVSTRELPQQL